MVALNEHRRTRCWPDPPRFSRAMPSRRIVCTSLTPCRRKWNSMSRRSSQSSIDLSLCGLRLRNAAKLLFMEIRAPLPFIQRWMRSTSSQISGEAMPMSASTSAERTPRASGTTLSIRTSSRPWRGATRRVIGASARIVEVRLRQCISFIGRSLRRLLPHPAMESDWFEAFPSAQSERALCRRENAAARTMCCA